MTKAISTESHSQAFRSSLSSNIISIPAPFDNTTQRHVVRWVDIQRIFENAKYVLNGNDAVTFMANDNLEDNYIPLRIGCHPGVVLKVAVSEGEQGPAGSASSFAAPVCDSTSEAAQEDVNCLSQQMTDVAIISPNPARTNPAEIFQGPRSSVQGHHQLQDSFFEALTTGQLYQAINIWDEMKGHIGDIQAEMAMNKDLQAQVLQMQRQMDAKQQQMLQMQQQTLDYLTLIHTRIQAVFTQTYELHEYPIPRLFIILPKTTRRTRDRIGNPFSDQFRLFFLCECGAHTMAEGSRVPHEIHLAKHEGYDINRPKEFVQKYGSFVLTMMQMVKYGFTAAGIIVPPLAHFGVVEGIDAVRKGLDLARTSIGSLIDQTIAFIQNQKNDDSGGIDLPTETINLDRLEVLEGTELRQLESYLNAGDKDHTLGNLYRTVTTEGHVKWVCLDHYRENYRESTTQRLKDAVTENGGVYNEEEGSVNICIQSKSRAKRFYKIMVKARGIQVLDITFGWDATLGDLRAFESAVLKANIIELTINGTHFNGPAMDFINRRRRFVPILNLICNGRIQSLRLNNTRHFDQHINGSFAAMAPRLRVLSLGPGFSLKNPVTASNFTKILTHCSSLNELRQYSEHNAPLFEATLDNIINLPNLQSMSFGSEAYSLHTAISKSMAHEVVMSILQLGDLSSDGEMILQKGRLTMLSLEQTPRTADESRLADLICQNPELRFLDIPCHGERSNEILSLISSTRDKILQGGSTTALSDIQLAKDTWFSFKTKSVLTSVAGHVVNEGDPISFTLDASIKMAGDDAIDENDISSVFRQFGWSVRTLKANSTFSDELAKLLDEATRLKGSSLRWLKLDPWSLTSPGLDCMDRIIERSLDLECLLLCNFGMDVRVHRDKAGRLIHRHATRLQGLIIQGCAAEQWISFIRTQFPGRPSFPVMKSFVLGISDKAYLSQADVQWLAAIVAAPAISSLSSVQDVPVNVSDIWTPFTMFCLSGCWLQPEDWEDLIVAMDFCALATLDFRWTNFSIEQLRVLADRISNDDLPVFPLRSLRLEDTDLRLCRDTESISKLHAALKLKAPLVTIMQWPTFSLHNIS